MVVKHIASRIQAVLIALLVAVGALSSGEQPKKPLASGPTLNLDDVWQQFRSDYPHPMQAVAVRKSSDGETILIVSEPPPHVTEADLKALLPGVKFARWRIGADGWVTDAIVRLKVSDLELRELVGELHQLMYGTAYKAYALDIPVQPQTKIPRPPLDLQIAADDALSWVVTGGATGKPVTFHPLIGGDAVTVAEIKESDSLVYHSDPEGLVGWWIPKKTRVSDCTVAARQFTVDSDLVVGAVGNERGVIILGRTRTVPYELLPPLRVESIKPSSRESRRTS